MNLYTAALERFRKENPEFVMFEKDQKRKQNLYRKFHIHVGITVERRPKPDKKSANSLDSTFF